MQPRIRPTRPSFLTTSSWWKNRVILSTIKQYGFSWKVLKSYLDRQSLKQYRLKDDSLTELLKHANLSISTNMLKDLVVSRTTLNSTLFPPTSHRPLALTVQRYESDIECRVGLELSTRPRAQSFVTYGTLLPGPENYTTLYLGGVSPRAARTTARPVQQNLREHSYTSQLSYYDRSTLLSSSYQPDLEQGDPKPEPTNSSWFVISRRVVVIVVVGVIGYFALVHQWEFNLVRKPGATNIFTHGYQSKQELVWNWSLAVDENCKEANECIYPFTYTKAQALGL